MWPGFSERASWTRPDTDFRKLIEFELTKEKVAHILNKLIN